MSLACNLLEGGGQFTVAQSSSPAKKKESTGRQAGVEERRVVVKKFFLLQFRSPPLSRFCFLPADSSLHCSNLIGVLSFRRRKIAIFITSFRE